MAMIECSECGNRISSKASSCPHCGVPISFRDINGTPLVTTQKTSKKYKIRYIIFMLMTGLGFPMGIVMAAGPAQYLAGLFMLVFIVGLIGLIVTRFQVWWDHE